TSLNGRNDPAESLIFQYPCVWDGVTAVFMDKSVTLQKNWSKGHPACGPFEMATGPNFTKFAKFSLLETCR
ncbi:MAG: hypothetical protein OXG94_08500, partial [Bacteroidetes bacterium]|nr:hypothetical protein [Bacteroidota bacterium]